MKCLKLWMTLTLSMSCLCYSAWAADTPKTTVRDPKAVVPAAKEAQKMLLPDLIVQSISVTTSNPKEGDVIGPIVVTIKNQGGATAGQNKSVIGCMGSNCFPVRCPNCGNFVLELSTSGIGWTYSWIVPPLNPKQSMNFTFNPAPIPSAGPPLSQRWIEGDYAFICTADRDKLVTESNEQNNIKSVGVKVSPQ